MKKFNYNYVLVVCFYYRPRALFAVKVILLGALAKIVLN
jgi:hypothetical protein